MVSISTYKALWEYMITVVPGIDKVLVVHEESDLASTIRDIDAGCVILIAVIPSSDVEATSSDDYEEIDGCYVFVVKKSDRGNLTHDEYLDELNGTQTIINAVKLKLIELSADNRPAMAAAKRANSQGCRPSWRAVPPNCRLRFS